jgi:hypothetical protein
MDQTPCLTALRVFGRLGIGLKASPADKRVLRESVAPREANLPIEELCCIPLKRELNQPKRARSSSQHRPGRLVRREVT